MQRPSPEPRRPKAIRRCTLGTRTIAEFEGKAASYPSIFAWNCATLFYRLPIKRVRNELVSKRAILPPVSENSIRLGRAMASLSTLCMTKGDLKNGVAFGAQAVAQGDIASKALGLPAMALNIQSMGRHAEAIVQFRETIAIASGRCFTNDLADSSRVRFRSRRTGDRIS